MREELGNKLGAVAATAAPLFSPVDLDQLHFARDMNKAAYQKVFTTLNLIRKNNENVKYVYILRPTNIKNIWEFVADADSNFNLDFFIDFDNDGIAESNEANISPGVRYDTSVSDFFVSGEVLNRAVVDDIFTDQWGTFISGTAPITDEQGNAVAVVGIDMEISDVYTTAYRRFAFALWFIIVFLVVSIAFLLLRKVFI
jgi:hypothetical protein